MPIMNNDRRSYGARDEHGDDREERRGSGYDRANYDRFESGSDRRYGADYGGPDDAGQGRYASGYPERGERGPMGREHRWQGGGAHGDDDAYSGGSFARERDADRDVGSARRGDGRGWYGGERRGGGYRGGTESGNHRSGGEAMGMGAGIASGVSMTGKGPKGYIRSDDRIKEDVCDCLTDDHHLDASSIEVQVRKGEVTLSGTVDSRHAKRHAEDLAERLSGVKHVQNNLRVQTGDTASGDGGPRTGVGTTTSSIIT